MSQIDELQRRITAALDRIGQGLDGLSTAAGPSASEDEGLRQQLEEETLANAQLQERVKALKEKQQAQAAMAELAQSEQAEALRKLDAELQSLRKANQQLRENNQALRDANAAGVGEPHLINKAMLAELDGLRAARAADRAEIDAVLADLGQAISTAEDGGNETAEVEEA
ncbi:hypothetical protein PEL8287_00126 [Roseovarius litorisediminis]|uniref:Colicin transporter n=1 Tax=Roseovarius litorisediminis TaxID=1312363 RepID=A0A1Y5R5T5_9RHOB|nr:hypothetical protein [Roseovarius litorisediminis]SLN09933.1 hypothetical protein PEL8287_00126 [Roseovarius litorisediminis]